jgi:UDP-glucose 4-epimerase
MAKCLVTGHEGYIGSRLYRKLKNLGHEVEGIDLNSSYPENVCFSLSEDAFSGFLPFWEDFSPDYIFHMACWPRVGYSIENPVKTMKNNVLATSIMLNYAKKNNVKRVIYSSSSSVVGNGEGPMSPYALQKLTSETECRLYSELYNLDTVSLRYFNVYSEDQTADGPYATAISNWMEYIRNRQNPFITGDGEQRRDMIHVDDAIAANIFAMEYDDNFNGKNYDVGTGKNISLNEIKEIVENYFPDIKFEYISPRKGDARITIANIHPLKALGW